MLCSSAGVARAGTDGERRVSLPGGAVFVWAEHARERLARLPKEKHFANQILFSTGFASQHNGSFSRACALVSISCYGPALSRLGEIDLMVAQKVTSIVGFLFNKRIDY